MKKKPQNTPLEFIWNQQKRSRSTKTLEIKDKLELHIFRLKNILKSKIKQVDGTLAWARGTKQNASKNIPAYMPDNFQQGCQDYTIEKGQSI